MHSTFFPKKSLSQCFLQDHNVIRKFLDNASLSQESVVLEVGPGLGALTRPLLAIKLRLVAIEKDRRLIPWLEETFAEEKRRGHFFLHEADALAVDLSSLTADLLTPSQQLTLISNLPFTIAARFLYDCASSPLFTSLHVIVQKEVGKKIKAKIGSSDYGPLALHFELYSETIESFSISRNCFRPTPRVDAMALSIKLKQARCFDHELSRFIHEAFAHRRKSLKKALSFEYEKRAVEQAFEQLSLSPTVRAEELSLPSLVALYKLLSTT